jgi:serine/threonine-protein kinase PRP4
LVYPDLHCNFGAVAVVSRGGEAHDNWDDSDGYYHFRPGDILNGQYQVFANQGRGVFSSVVRVRDLKAKPPVGGAREPEFVVKVIRNNEVMYKAGLREVEFLQLLEKNDPDHRRHCIHLVAHFEHHGHLCLVFEAFAFNLREIIKKYGAGLGLHISAVRSYAQQLVIALKLTKKCGLLHADLKPDNILVCCCFFHRSIAFRIHFLCVEFEQISEDNRTLKLCDFGSATATNDVEITPYLVARFYRAPEIMLGLPYDCAADMWSVGCTLYEMYTGKVLFAGKDNNEMLRMQQEARGAIPKRLLRRATFRDQHFDEVCFSSFDCVNCLYAFF